jgi:hypothetical protein
LPPVSATEPETPPTISPTVMIAALNSLGMKILPLPHLQIRL